MLPIMDMFIHRYLELESSGVSMPVNGLEKILSQIGSLYRFHHQPITFLYQTLYCYPQLAPKRKRILALIIVQDRVKIFLGQSHFLHNLITHRFN